MATLPAAPAISSRSRSRLCGLFGPLMLIAIGVFALLDSLHIAAAGELWNTYFPLVFIFLGIEPLFSPLPRRRAFGGILVVGGLAWIANNLGWLLWHARSLWPLFLIGLGILMLIPHRPQAPRGQQ